MFFSKPPVHAVTASPAAGTRRMRVPRSLLAFIAVVTGALCAMAPAAFARRAEPAFTIEDSQRISGAFGEYTKSTLTGEVGQTIEYQIVISDTGNTQLTLTGGSDSKCEGMEGETIDFSPGESATYHCKHLITISDQQAGSYTNSATASAAPPRNQGSEISHTSNTVVVNDPPPAPAFTIEKLQKLEGASGSFTSSPLSAKVGQTVDYQVVVKDTGNTQLTFSSFSDAKCEHIEGGPTKALSPSESSTYTCRHTLTVAGGYENAASVTATPPQGQGSAFGHTSNTVTTTVPGEPAFTIEKLQKIEGSSGSFSTSPLTAKLGQTVDYEVVIKDIGNTTLTFSSFTDTKCEAIEGGPSKALSPGESATYTCHHTLAAVGSYEDSASVTGTPPAGQGAAVTHTSNTVIATVAAEPAFTIEKLQTIEASSGSFSASPLTAKLGQTVDYQVLVKDSGNTQLTFSGFSDAKCEGVEGGPAKALSPGESATYTCHHVLTAAGSYENSASVTGTPPTGQGSATSHTSNTVTATVVAEPAFTVEKRQEVAGSSTGFTTAPITGKLGQTVDYEIVVKDTGNTQLTFSSFTDAKCEGTEGGPAKALSPGESATYTCHHTLAAVGSYENNASVTATPPEGQGSAIAHTSNTVIATVAAEPAFTIEKLQKIEGSSGSFSASPLTAKLGQTVDYQVLVKDSGNTQLTVSGFTDAKCEGVEGGPAKALSPGESATYTCHHTLAAVGSYENSASITGTPPTGQGSAISHTSNTVTATVAAEPAFTIETRQEIAGSGAGFTTSPLTGKTGQVVDYAVVVKDTGNTQLTFSGFSDAKCEGAGPIKALSPGESATYSCHESLSAAGSYESSATVSAMPPEGQGSAINHTSNKVIATVAAEPAFTIEMRQEIAGSGAGFTTSPLTGKLGQTVDYQVVIKDTGNTQLTFSGFTDAKCEGVEGGPAKALVLGESASYACHHTLSAIGGYENSASVTATPPEGQGSAITHTSNTVIATVAAEPAFAIEKRQEITGSNAGFTTSPLTGKLGQTVGYQVVVKDTGNTALTFTGFSDAKCEGVEGGPAKALSPGESASYTCHHTLAAIGGYENSASVTATPPEGQGGPLTHASNTVIATVAAEPAFTIEKLQALEGPSGSFTTAPLAGKIGQTVDYQVAVKDSGNTALTFSGFKDPNCEGVEGGPANALAPGESAMYTCHHTLSAVGSYETSASVTAAPPEGQGGPVAGTSNTVIATVAAEPAFTIEALQKVEGSSGSFSSSPVAGKIGQTVDYQVAVKDTGNTTLTFSGFKDPNCEGIEGGPAKALARGESAAYTCHHTLSAIGGYENSASVTATPPEGQGSAATHASNTATATVAAEPAFTIEKLQKVEGSSGSFSTSPLTGKDGQIVDYEVVVKDTGNTTLTFSNFSDVKCEGVAGGPSKALAPKEAATYTCRHMLAGLGSYTNSATVTATPPEGQGSPIAHTSNTVVASVAPEPAFTVEKLQRVEESKGFTTSPLIGRFKGTVEYEIIVKDTGNTELTFSSFEDAGCEGSIEGGPTQPLAPGKSATYTCERALAGAGAFENKASVTATPPGGQGSSITQASNTVVVTVPDEPAFTIEKRQQIPGSSTNMTTEELHGQVGQTVDYQVTVTDTGDTQLTFGTLADPRCDSGTLAGGPAGALAPGESAVYTCNHRITSADLSSGSYSNTAAATATPPSGQGSPLSQTSNTVVVTVAAEPAFTIAQLQKIEGPGGSFTSSPLSAKLGETVDYQLVATDTGNTQLTLGKLSDADCETIAGGATKPLAPGEVATYTCQRLLSSVGAFENVATITATPPPGQGSPLTQQSNPVSATVAPEPAFTIEKRQEIAGSGTGFTSSALTGKIGQTVDYQVVIKDTGNTQLTFSGFTDASCEGVEGGPAQALSPGEAATYICRRVLSASGSYENSATVTATPPEGQGSPLTQTSNTVVASVAPPATQPSSPTTQGPTSSSPAPTTPSTPPHTGILATKIVGPTLTGPRGCVRGKRVVISVKAAGVASVTFYLDGRKLKTVVARSARGGKLSITIASSTLRARTHKVVAKIRMKTVAGSTSLVFFTRRLTFALCG